jgi:hypothetical protein
MLSPAALYREREIAIASLQTTLRYHTLAHDVFASLAAVQLINGTLALGATLGLFIYEWWAGGEECMQVRPKRQGPVMRGSDSFEDSAGDSCDTAGLDLLWLPGRQGRRLQRVGMASSPYAAWCLACRSTAPAVLLPPAPCGPAVRRLIRPQGNNASQWEVQHSVLSTLQGLALVVVRHAASPSAAKAKHTNAP